MTYNEKANKASQKYHAAHMKRIPLSVPLEEYNQFKAACDLNGEKVNTVLRRMIKEYTKRAVAK